MTFAKHPGAYDYSGIGMAVARVRQYPGDDTLACSVLATIRSFSGGVIAGSTKGDVLRALRDVVGVRASRRQLNGALYWLTCAGWLKCTEERKGGIVVKRAYKAV